MRNLKIDSNLFYYNYHKDKGNPDETAQMDKEATIQAIKEAIHLPFDEKVQEGFWAIVDSFDGEGKHNIDRLYSVLTPDKSHAQLLALGYALEAYLSAHSDYNDDEVHICESSFYDGKLIVSIIKGDELDDNPE